MAHGLVIAFAQFPFGLRVIGVGECGRSAS
jgi:hypothetical protein